MPPLAGAEKNNPVRRVLRAAAALGLLLCGVPQAAPLEPFSSGGKWGFLERGTDTVLITPLYEQVEKSEDGLWRVAAGGLWGYVDSSGRVAAEPKYAEARPFSEGAAEARLPDGQWELLGRSGAPLLVSSAPALNRSAGGLTLFAKDGKFGYQTTGGRTVVEAEFAAAGAFNEGLAPARRPGGKWSFVGKSGGVVIRPEFEAVRGFSEGLAAFRLDGRWGFIDKKGRAVIKNTFHGALDFSGGLAAVRLNDRWGYIDPQGRLYISPEYTAVRTFDGALAAVWAPVSSAAVSGLRWIARDGAEVYRGAGPAGDGLEILVSTAGKYGFAREARPLLTPRYEGVAGCADGACLVSTAGRLAVVTHEGRVLSTTPYESGAALGCGLYLVARDGKFGVSNSAGREIIGAAYNSISGSGCDEELLAVSGEGVEGRLSPLNGTFASGPAVPPEPVIPISDKCRAAEPSLKLLNFADIPSHCNAVELSVMIKAYPDCTSCRLAVAAIHSSTAATGTPADAEGALTALADVIQLYSDTEKAWLHKWRVGLLLGSGEPSVNALRAVGEYRELMRLEPANPDHYRGICAAYSLLNGPPPEGFMAVQYCNQAVKNEPGAVKSLISRANLKRQLGDLEGAQEDFRTAIQKAPSDIEPRMARAKLSEALGQDYRVVFDCSKVLEAYPDNPGVLEDRAMAYLRMGICAKVLPDLEAAAKLRPGPENLHKTAAYYWACEKDLFKTLGAVEQLLKLGGDPAGAPYWKPEAYQRFLADLYLTSPYIEILKRYAPVAEPELPAAQPQRAQPGR